MTGGFTGVGAIPAFDKPMLVAGPGVNIPKKKKQRQLAEIHEQALQLAADLLEGKPQHAS